MPPTDGTDLVLKDGLKNRGCIESQWRKNFCAAFVLNEIRHHICIKEPGKKHHKAWLISSSPSSGCYFNTGKAMVCRSCYMQNLLMGNKKLILCVKSHKIYC